MLQGGALTILHLALSHPLAFKFSHRPHASARRSWPLIPCRHFHLGAVLVCPGLVGLLTLLALDCIGLLLAPVCISGPVDDAPRGGLYFSVLLRFSPRHTDSDHLGALSHSLLRPLHRLLCPPKPSRKYEKFLRYNRAPRSQADVISSYWFI